MRLRTALGAAAGVAAAGFGWGLAEATLFALRRVSVPALPVGSPDVRVLHLSDLHLLPRQGFKLDFLRRLQDLRPDLVVNTGDNIASAEAIEPLMSALGQLRFTPGVFVFGSNDYYAPHFKNPLGYILRGPSELDADAEERTLPTDRLREEFAAVGWHDLNHARAEFEVAGLRMEFRGTDDAHLDRDAYDLVAGPPGDVDLAVGVTHAPYLRVLDAMVGDGVEMVFAGHTHGGQVCVPGYGALVTNCDLDRARVKGLSTHTAGGRTAHLHVSAGLGSSPFAPYRFACRPEATLLTLTSR